MHSNAYWQECALGMGVLIYINFAILHASTASLIIQYFRALLSIHGHIHVSVYLFCVQRDNYIF